MRRKESMKRKSLTDDRKYLGGNQESCNFKTLSINHLQRKMINKTVKASFISLSIPAIKTLQTTANLLIKQNFSQHNLKTN